MARRLSNKNIKNNKNPLDISLDFLRKSGYTKRQAEDYIRNEIMKLSKEDFMEKSKTGIFDTVENPRIKTKAMQRARGYVQQRNKELKKQDRHEIKLIKEIEYMNKPEPIKRTEKVSTLVHELELPQYSLEPDELRKFEQTLGRRLTKDEEDEFWEIYRKGTQDTSFYGSDETQSMLADYLFRSNEEEKIKKILKRSNANSDEQLTSEGLKNQDRATNAQTYLELLYQDATINKGPKPKYK